MSAAAIAASSAAISAAAASQAAQAKREACEAIVAVGSPQAGDVDALKTFADCVNLLYPDPSDSTETLVLKVFVALIFAGAVVGLATNFFGKDMGETGVFARIISGLVGAVGVTVAGFILFLTVAGIQFLFS